MHSLYSSSYLSDEPYSLQVLYQTTSKINAPRREDYTLIKCSQKKIIWGNFLYLTQSRNGSYELSLNSCSDAKTNLEKKH